MLRTFVRRRGIGTLALLLAIPAGSEAQSRPSRGPAATPRTPAVQGYALPYSRDEGRRAGVGPYDEGRRGRSDRSDRGRRGQGVRFEARMFDARFHDGWGYDARLYDPRRDRWLRVRFDRDPLRYHRGMLDDRDLRRLVGRSALEALAFEARVGTRALHGRVVRYGPRGRWVTLEVWAGRRLVAALTDFDRDRRIDDIILSPGRLR